MYLQDYTYIHEYRVFVSELWLQSLYVEDMNLISVHKYKCGGILARMVQIRHK